jgi:tRNA(Ile)-lysidine synthase
MDILGAATRYRMFLPGETVLVAVSGGPDSVAMLHALLSRREDFGIAIHVAHLNHGIRGEAADMDEEFVRSLARDWNLPATVERIEVPALRRKLRMSEEEAARQVRYEFLYRTASEIGASKIAVGHTADDRAESVLMNVIRGTGIEGLGALRPVAGNIVRPLLDTWRSEVEAYIRENRLSFRVDESNLNLAYTRNRVRHELIPLLENHYNPRVKNALVRLAEIAQSATDFIEGAALDSIGKITYIGAIDAEMLCDLPEALRYQVVRSEVERIRGDLRDIEFEQIRRVVQALGSGDEFTITLPSGKVYAFRRGSEFRIDKKKQLPEVEPFEIELKVPGRTQIPQIGLVVEAERIESPQPKKSSLDVVLIPEDAITGTLRIRSVRPGDRIIPFGMHESKKLQDVFVDKKVPRARRALAVAVVDDEKILWVVGVVASEATRVTERTQRAIRLAAIG